MGPKESTHASFLTKKHVSNFQVEEDTPGQMFLHYNIAHLYQDSLKLGRETQCFVAAKPLWNLDLLTFHQVYKLTQAELQIPLYLRYGVPEINTGCGITKLVS